MAALHHIYYHCGIKSQKIIPFWCWGPNSMMVVYADLRTFWVRVLYGAIRLLVDFTPAILGAAYPSPEKA